MVHWDFSNRLLSAERGFAYARIVLARTVGRPLVSGHPCIDLSFRWALQARHLVKFKDLASKPRFDPDDEFHSGILGRRSIDLYAKN
jgi:hypothetical protein